MMLMIYQRTVYVLRSGIVKPEEKAVARQYSVYINKFLNDADDLSMNCLCAEIRNSEARREGRC
jgi:hypothetical protein